MNEQRAKQELDRAHLVMSTLYQKRAKFLQRMSLIPLALWIAGLPFPGFVAKDNFEETVSGAMCFLLGLMGFGLLHHAWLANIPFFYMLWSYWRKKQLKPWLTVILMLVGSLFALTIFTIKELMIKNEASSDPVAIGLGGYLWLTAIGTMFLQTIIVFLINARKNK